MTTSTQDRAAVAIVNPDGYSIGYADRDVPGYTPTTYYYETYDDAKAAATQLNERWGLAPTDAMDIVASSMRG